MNNYTYIIAGLPDFTPDWRQGDKSLEECLSQVKELLSANDQETVRLIEDGFDKEKIGQEFYKEALGHSNPFIRDFFQFDLNVRNAKVRYLHAEGMPVRNVSDIRSCLSRALSIIL